VGRPWRKASLACCCDPKGKEARRFFDRQVSTKGVEKTQIEAVSFKLEFMVGVVMYFCSAARNSPACKGKSLQCLRKCRFSYIDTSPALSARRHLTAALRPSCLHLAVKLIRHGALPDISERRRLFSAPNSELFTGNYGCNRRRMARPRQAPGTACEAVRCSRAGCEDEGRLRCASK